MKNTFVDRFFLFLFVFVGVALLISFLPPIIDFFMGILVSFTSDGEFNVTHWKNIFNLYALKYLYIDIILFIFIYNKYKNKASLKDAFELFVDQINKMSRPVQVLLAFSLILLFHSFITLDTFDDEWFKKQIQEYSIFPFISGRYFTWTSRFLIELLMTGVLQLMMVYGGYWIA